MSTAMKHSKHGNQDGFGEEGIIPLRRQDSGFGEEGIPLRRQDSSRTPWCMSFFFPFLLHLNSASSPNRAPRGRYHTYWSCMLSNWMNWCSTCNLFCLSWELEFSFFLFSPSLARELTRMPLGYIFLYMFFCQVFFITICNWLVSILTV